MAKISIVTACYNEAGNITELYERITAVMTGFSRYEYDIICIDNCSTDGTREEIRQICRKDKRFKAIFNARNFGHIRSPWHALMQADGDAVIFLCSDLEDPPELIADMLLKWEEGFTLVFPIRRSTQESGIFPRLRTIYYWLMQKISTTPQLPGFTGFGLYDKSIIDIFHSLNEPYPYVRGLVCELGWNWTTIPFDKPVRKHGVSKGNFLVYFDIAMLGIVSHSKIPLRLATIMGICISCFSFLAGAFYLVMKLIYWNNFQAGMAPLVVSMFFFMGLLFFFLGLIGEYISLIVTHVVKRPLVIEQERINFS